MFSMVVPETILPYLSLWPPLKPDIFWKTLGTIVFSTIWSWSENLAPYRSNKTRCLHTAQFVQFTPIPAESESAQHLHGEISGVFTTAPPHPEVWGTAAKPKTKQQLLLPHCAVVSSSQDSGSEWDQFTPQTAQGERWGQIKGSIELSDRRPQMQRVKCEHG